MLLEQLRYFHAVAQNQSFTRAAGQLHLTQPAVSSHIINLEQELEQKLFERLGKRVKLTQAGEILYAQSRRIFQQMREIEDTLNGLKGLDTGKLSLGTIDMLSIYVLPRMFREFNLRYPKVEILIEVDNSTNLCAKMVEGELDLGFVTLPVKNQNLNFIPVFTDVMKVIAPADHPLAGRERISLQDLAGMNLIIYKKGSVTRGIIDRVFESSGVEMNPAMELDRPEAMKKLVEIGLGVSIIPEISIKHELEEGLVVTLPLEGVSFTRRLGLIYRKGQQFSPAALAFLEIVRETVHPKRWIEGPASGRA